MFSRYVLIGAINTLIHWFSFGVFFYVFSLTQSLANVLAFCIAVTFSFFANAKWTFKSQATSGRYIVFVLFMGLIAGLIGYIAESIDAYPMVTLATFSSLSLVAGFIYSKFIVFREIK